MTNTNFYSPKMLRKSVVELQKYIDNKTDYQEDAVLAAIWELENRAPLNPEIQALKQELEAQNKQFEEEPIAIKNETIALYSFNFIFLFGILFSVFAASILIGLNLIQLKNKPRSRMVLFTGLSYSFLQVYLIELFKITSPFVSIFSSLLGVYLLYYYFLKPELNPKETYQSRSTWQPLLIGMAIALPIAYYLMKAGGVGAL